MKSMYRRQFFMMVGVILTSFALLGFVFVVLSYQYFVKAGQESMERNASYISVFTSTAINENMGVESSYYRAYVSSVAMISDTHVMVCNPDGRVVYASDRGTNTRYAGLCLPQWAVDEVMQGGSYSGMTTLNGIYPTGRYVAGAPVISERQVLTPSGISTQKTIHGMVFISSDTSDITELWQTFIWLFLLTALAVLLVASATSSVTSFRLTRPLKEMADAARQFGHGEFDTRVTGHAMRQDEIGELAEAFNSMADSLAKAEAQRSEFVANISHELKTPMTTIAGFADGILDGTIPPERQEESLKVISSETRRLSRLVRRMLDLSRLQAADRVEAQERFDITEVFLRVLVSLEGKINDRNLDVNTDLPEDPVMVWGSPDSITQVCYNLLDNAIKFSMEGGTLGIGITTGKGGKVLVSVRNQGETIPPEELSLIFDRFHKIDHSRSEDRDGVGLGLYIVKAILNAHKENITVTSEDGVTIFTFTLTQA